MSPLLSSSTFLTFFHRSNSPPTIPTATASTSRISNSEAYKTIAYSLNNINVTVYTQSYDPGQRSRHRVVCSLNEEPTTTSTMSWHIRTLSLFTLYGELSVADTPAEFALVRSRLQQEWTFGGGLVSRFTTVILDSQLIAQRIARWYCCVRFLPYVGDSVC